MYIGPSKGSYHSSLERTPEAGRYAGTIRNPSMEMRQHSDGLRDSFAKVYKGL